MQMTKKFVFKIIFLTIAVVLILALSAFGVASLLAPAFMMDLSASVGLKSISGDYAFQEFERSGNVEYLARAFIISADMQHDRTANERFTILYELDEFDEFCASQDASVEVVEGLEGCTYRGYICGLAACVRYRLAVTEEDVSAVVAFAAQETAPEFPLENPLILLTMEGARSDDAALCELILAELTGGGYDAESADYANVVGILEDVIDK